MQLSLLNQIRFPFVFSIGRDDLSCVPIGLPRTRDTPVNFLLASGWTLFVSIFLIGRLVSPLTVTHLFRFFSPHIPSLFVLDLLAGPFGLSTLHFSDGYIPPANFGQPRRTGRRIQPVSSFVFPHFGSLLQSRFVPFPSLFLCVADSGYSQFFGVPRDL